MYPGSRKVSALFPGVSRLSRCVRLVFWCFQTVVLCPLCFLLCGECDGLSALFCDVSRMWWCVRLVFWCDQNVVVCPSFLMVCPKCGGVSALFSGVSRMWWCPSCFLARPECGGVSKCCVSTFFSVLSRLSRVVPLVSSKVAAMFSQTLSDLFSSCCRVLTGSNLSSRGQSVLLLSFSEEQRLHHPPLTPISALDQCFPLYPRFASYCEYYISSNSPK